MDLVLLEMQIIYQILMIVYVSQSQIYKFKLKTGDFITGVVREPKASEKFRSLLHIQKSIIMI